MVRMRSSALFLASLGLLSSQISAASDPGSKIYCPGGCMTALNLFQYDGPGSNILDPLAYYELIGQNPLFLKSFYYCGIYYCSEQERKDGFAYLTDTCQTYAGFPAVTAQEVGVPDNMTKQDIDNLKLPVVTYDNITNPSLTPLTTPIFASPDFFTLGRETFGTFDDALNLDHTYGYAMFIFWGIVCGFGVCSQIVKYTRNFLASRSSTDVESHSKVGKKSLYSRARLWVAGNLITAPTFGYHHLTPIGQATIPRRLESLVILAFVIINIVLYFPGYNTFNNNLYYADKKNQLTRYVADRGGMLAQATLLITWMFGSRNNVLMWLTGWSFSTFNAFHRWVGRLCVIHIIVHSAAYTVFSFAYDTWHDDWKEEYWYTGEASTIAFCLILGFSFYWMRQKMYDIFLTIHIVLAIVGLVTLWYHLNIFEGEYDGWFWPAVGIWVLDRLLRTLRVCHVWLRSTSARANITYDETADILTVDATKCLEKVKPAPGTYYFLYLPTKYWGWQAHPFTLVSWKSNAFTDDSSNGSTPPQSVNLAVPDEKGDAAVVIRPRQNSAVAIQNATQNYTFSIRPHKGFTSTLRNFCVRNPKAAANVPVFLEGPYGTPHPIPRNVSDVLLVMGGTGVNVAVNYVYQLLQRSDQSIRIKLVWALRYQPFLKSHLEGELRDVVESGRVKLEAHVTASKPTHIPSTTKETSDKATETDLLTAINLSPRAKANISIDFQRPYVPDVVQQAAEAASSRLAIVVCGPARMADDCRAAAVRAMRQGKDIEFLEEQFGW